MTLILSGDEFYQCNLINWKEILLKININLPLNINNEDMQLCINKKIKMSR